MIMNNFELIDDYLTNRLGEAEKAGFEKQLVSDPALKADVDLQKQILEGIKKHRATELKSMLNNVPVSSGTVIHFSVARLAAGLIAAGVVSAAIYFYLKPGDVPNMTSASADLAKKGEQIQSKDSQITKEEEAKKDITTVVQPEAKNAETKNPSANLKSSKEAASPKLDVTNPSDELVSNKNEPAVSEVSKGAISISHIEVTTDSANKNYNFHYQFASGKLYLYGAFDKSLYEILEINSDNKALFLFYKDNYYLLDGKQLTVTRLEPITDPGLLKKLKEYRSK
jgi:hypothetical protein